MITNGPVVIDEQDVSVGVGATVYSTGKKIIDMDSFALEYKVSCTGTPSIKIEMEQSTDGSNWYKPDTLADVASNITDENYHGAQLAPITVGWIRFKITELTEVVTDSVVSLKLSAQKRFSV